MYALGFSFTSLDFRVVCLSQENQVVSFVAKEKINYPKGLTVPDLMGWCETQFELLFTRYKANRLAHKTSKEISTLKQVTYSCYPQAILNLVAKKKDIRIESYSVQGINGTKLGLSKSEDVFNYVDDQFGTHPPYWDRSTKEAALVAWFTLLNK